MTRLVSLVALCVLIFTAACGGARSVAPATPSTAPIRTGAHVATPSPSGDPTTTTAIAEASDREQIIAMVERFYEVVIEANNPPDPESDLWGEVAVPALATGLRARSAEKLEAGEANRYPIPRHRQVLAPDVPILADDAAVINICLRDDTVLHDLLTADVLNDDVVFVWVQHRLVETTEGWKIAATTNVERFEEESPCIASYR